MKSKKRRSRKKHTQKRKDKYGVKILIGLLVLGVAIFARFSESDMMTAAKEKVLSVLNNGVNYKDAVDALGQIISGGGDNTENAAAVFARKLLGIEDAGSNVYDETSPQERQNGETTGEVLRSFAVLGW